MGSLSSKPETATVDVTTAAVIQPDMQNADQVQQQQQCMPSSNVSMPPLDAQMFMNQMQNDNAAHQRQGSFQRRAYRSGRLSLGAPAELLPTNQNFNDDDDLNLQAASAAASEQPEPDPAVVGDGALSVNTRVEYSALPRGQMQDVFGLVTVQGSAAPEPDPSGSSASTDDERQPMDLMCVLDVSGSMRGDKIRQVQDAMRFIIDQAIPKDRLSIVTFNHQGQRVLRLRKMDMEGKNSATVTTLQLSAGGGTSIASGLSTALDVMEQRRQRNKVSAILLLTDGQDGSTRHHLPALIARAQQANCSIYGFGFGKDHDAALLSDLAEQAQTPFTFVENTENIREAFAGAVGGLSSIVAQAVELTITSHVQLKNVHTPFATRMTSATCACVTIPDIFAGERRDILVELSVPTGPTTDDKTKLLEAQVSYRDLRSGILMQTPVSVMEASVVEEPQPEAEPDEEVTAQRERFEVTRVLQQASAQSDAGHFEEAQQMLDAVDQRMKGKKTRTSLNVALCSELADAKSRMARRSVWEGGGRAEVRDATQMHKMQRATNMMASSSACVTKSSKRMYCNSKQAEFINMSKS